MDSITLPRSTGTSAASYAQCIAVSKRIRWDIDRDVLRGRGFDFSRHFLPEGLARVGRLAFLDSDEQRLLGQIQGRTYANMFGLVERFIGIKMLQASQGHWFGDQVALEALVRFTDEELKHQALFRRIEQMLAAGMDGSYEFVHQPDQVAAQVLQASSWAVLALSCHIELFTQVHYRESIAPGAELCPLFRDVFLFHWREESQHAILDELEWAREDKRLSNTERDVAVDQFIGLVGAVDGIVQQQARADARYFQRICGRALRPAGAESIAQALLEAYRWQYIVSGARDARFNERLGSMTSPDQQQRIQRALAPLVA